MPNSPNDGTFCHDAVTVLAVDGQRAQLFFETCKLLNAEKPEIRLLTDQSGTGRTAPFERHILRLDPIAGEKAQAADVVEPAAPRMRPTQFTRVCLGRIYHVLNGFDTGC